MSPPSEFRQVQVEGRADTGSQAEPFDERSGVIPIIHTLSGISGIVFHPIVFPPVSS